MFASFLNSHESSCHLGFCIEISLVGIIMSFFLSGFDCFVPVSSMWYSLLLWRGGFSYGFEKFFLEAEIIFSIFSQVFSPVCVM